MGLFAEKNSKPIVGRAPEDLTPGERLQNAGKWIALELYSPPVLKEEQHGPEIELRLRRIRALGNSVLDCIRQLEQAGLDPRDFEFTQLTPPFRG